MLGLFITISAHATPENQDYWMVIQLGGKKIGHVQYIEESGNHQMITTMKTNMTIDRGPYSNIIQSTLSVEVSHDGTAISFNMENKISNIATKTYGQIIGNTLKITKSTLGGEKTSEFEWKDGLKLFDNNLKNDGIVLEKGFKITERTYIPSFEQEADVTYEVIGTESVNIVGQDMELYKIETTSVLKMMTFKSISYVDEGFNLKKSTMQMMGSSMDMFACPKSCALSPNDQFDVFAETKVDVPTKLESKDLLGRVTYSFKSDKPLDEFSIPESAEQSFKLMNQMEFVIQTDNNGQLPDDSRYEQKHLDTNDWIESDNQKIIDLTYKVINKNKSDSYNMLVLEKFVRNYIADKNFSIGYASALETVIYKNGDCTEHALLLAAMARVAGIPTRIATGLVYNQDQNILAGHAWVQAWINGKWRSYDASSSGFDAGHIALSYGNGEPNDFYSGIMLIGHLELSQITIN
ncbi:MAG: lasso peptide biosynthesis protein [Proteobacteria bacterium]|nr:lasso peptide biosynthesis protein [Pseudomonadota bacterium]